MWQLLGRRGGSRVMTGVTRRWTVPLVLLVAGLLCLGSVAGSDGSDDDMRGIRRQISLMTKVFDALLVESPNVLVAGRNVAHGLYLEGYGVILGASVSLDLPNDWSIKGDFFDGDFPGVEITKDEKGRHVIVLSEDEAKIIERLGRDDISEPERHALRWEGVREEIFQLLADYGPTLRGLKDDERVGVALYRWDMLAGEEGAHTMLIEVGRSDLTSYVTGQLSDEGLRSRIKVTEY